MANKAKIVVIAAPRTRKLTKGQIFGEGAITGIMSMMSIGGTIEQDLVFKLRDEPGKVGLPRTWFNGDSQFIKEILRVMNQESYDTLYQWAKTAGIPAFSGEIDGEPSCMVLGPYWADDIDDLIARAIPIKTDIRPYTTDPKIDEK
jgi:hypothetical protein